MTDLAVVPTERETLIVVGTSVRKPLNVLRPFLQSLEWQELPPGVKLVPVFVPDWPDPKDLAAKYLSDWVKKHEGHIVRGVPTNGTDFADAGHATHQWSVAAMRRVGANKNRIIAKAAELRADAIWFVDADLILDRTTLWSLYHTQHPVACAVYWTRWNLQAPISGPQVWLRHPYELSGRGMEEAEFRARLAGRELVQVWGQGACTLIQRPVWEAGVNFDPFDPAQEGLMAGEDRQFCQKAERLHIPMWADGWPDIFHQYHIPQDVDRAPEFIERLGTPHPDSPDSGHLVSLILQACEPIPQPNGSQVHVQPVPVRGRLEQVGLVPQLEAEVRTMKRGESRIVPVEMPLHHPIAFYRGRKRLFKVTLVDTKPNLPQPNL